MGLESDDDRVLRPVHSRSMSRGSQRGSRRIQKRRSQTLPKRVHFADDDGTSALVEIRYITPRNSMSMDKVDGIWAVLDQDKDGLLNFKELSYFAKTVFLDVQDSDVRDMLIKEDTGEMSEGLNFSEWCKVVRNTDADVERLVDDLYRVFVLGEEITDPDDEVFDDDVYGDEYGRDDENIPAVEAIPAVVHPSHHTTHSEEVIDLGAI